MGHHLNTAHAFLNENGFADDELAEDHQRAKGYQARITNASLDQVERDGEEGRMQAFGHGTEREGILESLREIRRKQVEIFREHMLSDIFFEPEDGEASPPDFQKPDFLRTWQKEYQKKEAKLDEISKELEKVAEEVQEVNKKHLQSSQSKSPLGSLQSQQQQSGYVSSGSVGEQSARTDSEIRQSGSNNSSSTVKQAIHKQLPETRTNSPGRTQSNANTSSIASPTTSTSSFNKSAGKLSREPSDEERSRQAKSLQQHEEGNFGKSPLNPQQFHLDAAQNPAVKRTVPPGPQYTPSYRTSATNSGAIASRGHVRLREQYPDDLPDV